MLLALQQNANLQVGIANLAQTLGNTTGSIAGAVDVQGVVSQTLANTTGSIAGTVDVQGAVSQTLANTAATIAGSVDVQGSLSQTLGNTTGSIAGAVDIQGAVSQTLGSTTGSISGAVDVQGSVTQTLGDTTGSISGTVSGSTSGGLHLGARHFEARHLDARHLGNNPVTTGEGAGHFAARHFQANFYHSRHWDAETAATEETESVSGGWLSPEQARAVLRKIHRKRAEKAKRAEELQAAIKEARQAELDGASPEQAIAPVLEIVERDTGVLFLPILASLEDALSQLGMIDQQIAALNQRRMDDAAAVLLLMDI